HGQDDRGRPPRRQLVRSRRWELGSHTVLIGKRDTSTAVPRPARSARAARLPAITITSASSVPPRRELRSRGAPWTKPRECDLVVDVVEDDFDLETHRDVTLHEVPVDERTFVEVHEHDVVGDVVGEGSDVGPMEDGEREHLALPGGHDPIEV